MKKYDYDMSKLVKLPDIMAHEFEVRQDDIDRAVSNLLLLNAKETTFDEGKKAQLGDIVKVSYVAYELDKNGSVLQENGENVVFDEAENLPIYLGAQLSYEELEKEIVGMSVGENKKIRFSFPTNNLLYSEQKVLFDITVNGFLVAPRYNDAFAKECAGAVHTDSTEKLEEHIFTNMLLCKIHELLNEKTVILSYPRKEYGQMKQFVENTFKQSVEDIDSSYPTMSADEDIKRSMCAEMIFYALRDMIGKSVQPTEKEIEEYREKQINELAKSYVSTDETKALSEARKEIERLGEIYTYEHLMYEKIDNALVKMVRAKKIPSTLKYVWKNNLSKRG